MKEENKKTKDYEYVLLERLENKIDGIAEGQNILKEELTGKIDRLAGKVDSLEGKVDLLVEDMDYVKGELVEIRDRFKEDGETMREKADKKAVENHEVRIAKLENTAAIKIA
jgi:outer membrane murein-binding lipoprotein Lpp